MDKSPGSFWRHNSFTENFQIPTTFFRLHHCLTAQQRNLWSVLAVCKSIAIEFHGFEDDFTLENQECSLLLSPGSNMVVMKSDFFTLKISSSLILPSPNLAQVPGMGLTGCFFFDLNVTTWQRYSKWSGSIHWSWSDDYRFLCFIVFQVPMHPGNF